MSKVTIALTAHQRSLLNKIVALASDTTNAHCVNMLEIGSLCNELILDFVKGGGRGFTARALLKDSLSKFDHTMRPARLVGVYQIWKLLGKEEPPTLAHAVIREFYPLIQRDRETEKWSIREGYKEKALALYREASDGHWTRDLVFEKVMRLLGRYKRPRTSFCGRVLKNSELFDSIKDANPRDVADLVVTILEKCRNPQAALASVLKDNRVVAINPSLELVA